MIDTNSLGKKIADARHAKGITQRELAKAVGVTAQAVSKWEKRLSRHRHSRRDSRHARRFGLGAAWSGVI